MSYPNPSNKSIVPVLGDERSRVRIKYKDIFDIKAFYEALYFWLMDNGWRDCEDNDEHWETYYYERKSPNGMKELWFRWRVKKKKEEDLHAPLQYYLYFDFHVLGLTSTEVVKQGQKISTNKGEIDFEIRGYIEKLYEKEFTKRSLIKELLDFFNKRVYQKSLEVRKKELYQEIYVLQNFIKQWFKLKRYHPYEEGKSFYPSSAWPSHLKE